MNDERKAKRVFIVVSVVCGVFPGLLFLVYLLKITSGLFGREQILYKMDEFPQDIYYVILLGFSTIVPPMIAYLNYDEARIRPDSERIGMSPISQEGLTHERNIFLGGYGALMGLHLLLQFVLAATIGVELAPIVILMAKAGSVYLVFRLSRFLRQPVWLTILYCVLMPFSLLYLIPFIGLLVAVRMSRNSLGSASQANDERATDQIQKPARSFFPRKPLYQVFWLVVVLAIIVLVAEFFLWPENKDKSSAITAPKLDPSRQEGKQQRQKGPSLRGEEFIRSLPDLNRALLTAADEGNAEKVRILLDAGGQANCRDSGGHTALWVATFGCKYAVVHLLLERGADVNAVIGCNPTTVCSTALTLACSAGCKSVVDLLLANGADVNFRDDLGKTALSYSRGHPEIAKTLKAHGAIE